MELLFSYQVVDQILEVDTPRIARARTRDNVAFVVYVEVAGGPVFDSVCRLNTLNRFFVHSRRLSKGRLLRHRAVLAWHGRLARDFMGETPMPRLHGP